MTEKTEDDIKQELFEKLLEIWQPNVLLDFVRSEYKRGFEAGTAAAKSQEDLDRAYHRGRESVLEDVRKLFPSTARVVEGKSPFAKSIVEVPSEPETDPPKVATNSHASKGVGRGPKPTNIDRPEGIPSNYEMCRLVLIDAGIPLTATEIRDRVAKRWWPNVPGDWKSSPFGFLGSGKLLKNAEGKFILPEAVPANRVIAKKPDPQEVINREVERRAASSAPKISVPAVRREVVTPGAKLGAPARGTGVTFEHKGKSVVLHERERTIATKLRVAMGVGHIDAKFLAGQIGIRSDAEPVMREFTSVMNGKLEAIGLRIDWHKGFGFSMLEI